MRDSIFQYDVVKDRSKPRWWRIDKAGGNLSKLGYMAVMDTETSGVPSLDPRSRVLEVAAAILDERGKTIAFFESLCDPGERYWKGDWATAALTINGIKRSWLYNSQPATHVGEHLRGFLRYYGVTHLTSYNVAFDFDPHLLSAPEWLGPILPSITVGPCLMELAKKALGGQGDDRLHLKDALEHFGLEHVGTPHRAGNDVVTTIQLAQRLLTFDRSPNHPIHTK